MKIETMANVPLSEYGSLVEANQVLEDMRKIMSSNSGNPLEQIAALLDFEKVEVFDDIPAEDGMEYYVYELELENVSDREKHAHYGSFVCYADDVLTTQIYGYDDILKGTLIEKGNKARGTVVFLVPKDAELVELLFQYNMEDERLVFAVD